jgi:hypothetical protein
MLVVAALSLLGCPGAPSSHPNPPQLWIAPNGGETAIKLSSVEPIPF